MSSKFSEYTGRFLYASKVRAMLSSTPIGASDMMNELISVNNNFMYCIGYSDRGDWFDEEKAEFFSYALGLSYIPFGDAGREYYAKKLNGIPVWQYRYETAINILSLDNAFIDESEADEIRQMIKDSEAGKARYDLGGIVNIVFSSYFTYGFGKYKEPYEALITRLQGGEASVELPKEQCELDEKKMKILDYLYTIRQNNPRAFAHTLSDSDYADVAHKKITSFIAVGDEKSCKAGDVLKLKWDCIVLDATVTAKAVYPDYLSLPKEKYGFDYKSYNPYFYDNETAREQGGLTLVTFETAERARHNIGDYHIVYRKETLGEVEVGGEFTLILKDEKVYETLYCYDTFVMKDAISGEGIVAQSGGHTPDTVYSKEELLKKLDTSLPMTKSLISIENDTAIKDYEYESGVLLIKVTRTK